jgi:hypothetical protein
MPDAMLRLISPAHRRIVFAPVNQPTSRQLIALGWREYSGPARVTSGLDEKLGGVVHVGARNGWIIPGTDPEVDTVRQLRTGTKELGYGHPAADRL